MGTRDTAVSRSFRYATAECTSCGDRVFIDEEENNVDQLPKGVNVVLTGGENMTVNKTSITSAAKKYLTPKVLVKIFARGDMNLDIDRSYLCPACAQSIYSFEVDR